MAISQNCLLTTPSLAAVTSSVFCPPQQRSPARLGRGQRRLCQPGAARPTHGPGTQQVPPARLPACTPLGLPTCWNASAEGKGPSITQGNDSV